MTRYLLIPDIRALHLTTTNNTISNMSKEIGDILQQLIESAPAGELEEVYNDLMIMFPNQSGVVNKTLTRLAEKQGIVLNGKGIANQENKDSQSGKFWDYENRKTYNTDFEGSKIFDSESSTPQVEYPHFYNNLVKELKFYGEKHFPSQFEYQVIPKVDSLVITLIGQKLNKSNFYTGRWTGTYTINSTMKLAKADILLDIHYYEEGNVRFDFKEEIEEDCEFTPSAILSFIERSENAVLIKVVNQFTLLNQKYFKNLRRLLPVTKSKINWGNAIGNYKLGTDVIEQS